MIIERDDGQSIMLNPRQSTNLILAMRYYSHYCNAMAKRTRDTGYKRDFMLQSDDAMAIAVALDEAPERRSKCEEFEYATFSDLLK